MQIHIDTSQPLDPHEKALLRALLGEVGPETPPKAEKAPETPPKARTTTKKAAAPKPKPEPETEESDDELDPVLLEKAVSTASDLMKQGQIPKVKQALETVGAAKVTHLDSNRRVRQFLGLLAP